MATTSSPRPTSTDDHRQSIRRTISGQGSDEQEYEFDFSSVDRQSQAPDIPHDVTLEHNGKRSLANIGLQAYWLGVAFAVGVIFSIQFLQQDNLIWRLFAFVACLAVFHFLEYWTTARFNLPAARSNSFLLFTNGAAYNVAYSVAVVEILLSALLFQNYGRWATTAWSKSIGALLIVIGQAVRSIAMAQAGTNFNHIPQKTRKEGHVLVTSGVYSWLRHPSYFGFFWWALGTQLLVGNKFCALGYTLVLWRFFHRRIIAEERTLVEFFEQDYVKYRSSTSTGIPFIK